MTDQTSINDNNIKVLLRVRPLNQRELEQNPSICVFQNQEIKNKISLQGSSLKTFDFHFISNVEATQEEVFQLVGKPMVDKCLEGYNGCIFAYGQTGSGKTYTMQGKGLEDDDQNKATRGLQPHVFDYLFYKVNKQKREKQIDFYIKSSYFEIYNEQIIDLLKSSNLNLQVREDIHKGVYIENLSEEQVYTSQEMLDILRRGAKNRHVGSTRMNFESSRSHSVLQMTIETKKTEKGMSQVKASNLYFIDLAGSERQKQTEAIGQRLKEANNINKSLTTLGLVINSLVIKSKHVPYRDSKLTFILRDSLGGNSCTFMIANISPSSIHFSETLGTLNFAQRAKQVTNSAKINEEVNGSVEALKFEIRQLKEQLQEITQNKSKNYSSETSFLIMTFLQ